MEKITLNRRRYIGLAEFNHLRKNLIKDVYDRYERDENGKIPLSERDAGYIDALSHIMTSSSPKTRIRVRSCISVSFVSTSMKVKTPPCSRA